MRLLLILTQYYSCSLAATASRNRILVRGGAGGSHYELNPNYVPHHSDARAKNNVNEFATIETTSNSRLAPFQFSKVSHRPASATLAQLFQAMRRLQDVSPSLFYTTLSGVAVFIAWQLPFMHFILRNYFVLSHSNLANKRIPCLMLASVSHEGFFHLIGNILVLLTFGSPVKQMLRTAIWPLLLGAAMAGSMAFLLLDRKHVGSLGLSDVTLAVVAVYARMLPKKRLTTVIAGLIPVHLEAQRLLMYLLGSSAFGVMIQKRSPIAHSSHLGGLLFGMAYYEVWQRYLRSQKRK